jgi:hypothetical protein
MTASSYGTMSYAEAEKCTAMRSTLCTPEGLRCHLLCEQSRTGAS